MESAIITIVDITKSGLKNSKFNFGLHLYNV